MKPEHHSLFAIPLSPYAWQAEAFKVAGEAHRRELIRTYQVTAKEQRWVERGERLGRFMQATASACEAIWQRLLVVARRTAAAKPEQQRPS